MSLTGKLQIFSNPLHRRVPGVIVGEKPSCEKGAFVGRFTGLALGSRVGSDERVPCGATAITGAEVGAASGLAVGVEVGVAGGLAVGAETGMGMGGITGVAVGDAVGAPVGVKGATGAEVGGITGFGAFVGEKVPTASTGGDSCIGAIVVTGETVGVTAGGTRVRGINAALYDSVNAIKSPVFQKSTNIMLGASMVTCSHVAK